MKNAKVLIISLVTLLGFSLTACGLGGNSSDATKGSENRNQVKEMLSKVSKADFDTALENVTVYRDEFKGNFEIFGEANLTRVGSSFINLSFSLNRDDANSEWQTVLLSSYAGEDWMFHNEWNLKSSKGILNVDINSLSRDDQVKSGYVQEVAVYSASQDEIVKFCEIAAGTEVKFRLRGIRGGVKDITGDMTQSALKDAKDLCVIYFGLRQGFEISS